MPSKSSMLNFALVLAVITVLYNVVEGLISVYFGMAHETLALFGFGLDSFVEVISGVGIWHMVLRIRQNGDEHRDKFEKTALKITGTVFYLLAVGLLVTSIYNLINGSKPENPLWGVIISSISIFSLI